jgi:large subunit ribosomal protein L21
VTPVASRTAPLPLAACAVARSAVRSLLPPAAGGLRSPADGPSRRLASASASPAQPPALPACYTRLDARVEAPFQLAPRDVFAVVQAGSHQFKVTLDDLVYVERVPQLDINDTARSQVGGGLHPR